MPKKVTVSGGGGSAAAGNDGRKGKQGVPGAPGEDGDEFLAVPGRRGVAGADGSAGATGTKGRSGAPAPGADGEDGLSFPGRPGKTGSTGTSGADGQKGRTHPPFVPQDGEDGFAFPPGRRGLTGPAGAEGGSSSTTRSWFVSPQGNAVDDATQSSAATTPDLVPILLFSEATGRSGAYLSTAVPTDWVSGSITCYIWWRTNTATGNVRWLLSVGQLSVGDSPAEVSDLLAEFGTTVADSTTMLRTSIGVFTPTAAGALLKVNLERNAGVGAGDTATGNASVALIEFQYTATTVGAAGARGSKGVPTIASDGEDGMAFPPRQGRVGAAGSNGADGAKGRSAIVMIPDDGLDGMTFPAPRGRKGDTGAPGGGGGSATTVETNLGTAMLHEGKFTITDAAITGTSKVLCWQAPGPYTGKGTRADEAAMAPIRVLAVEPAAGSAVVRWDSSQGFTPVLAEPRPLNQFIPVAGSRDIVGPQEVLGVRARGMVRGNIKFSYLVFA